MKKGWMRLLVLLILTAGIFLTGKISAKAAPLAMPDGTVFDPVYYAETYPDLKTAFGYNGGLLWKHYVTFGRNEGRICTASPSAVGSVLVMSDGTLFDPTFYAQSNPDVVAALGDSAPSLWNHYVKFGRGEGRLAYPGEVKLSVGNVNLNVPYPYYIKINRAACTVTVYGADENGNYTIPCKAFICSPGRDTPLGVFKSAQNARWLAFDAGQYGQYAKRIVNRIWFHSVMYNGTNEGSLDWGAYNRLGTICSHGCIRLQAGDANWIYTNCPVGTVVEIYDDPTNPGPLGRPEVGKISASDPRRGWDPTDPNPLNPWLQ